MCPGINIISKTKNGIAFQCANCENIQVLFNNLDFSFTDKEYFYFCNYISSIDIGYYEHHCKGGLNNRKIQIPIGHNNLLINFSVKELEEFKLLFKHSFNDDYKVINFKEIHNKLFMN